MPLDKKNPTTKRRQPKTQPLPIAPPPGRLAPLPRTRLASNSEVGHFRAEDLSNIPHGLNFPSFDPNNYFAGDLFSDSSALQRTTREEADAALMGISEKRNTMEVVTANLNLNRDVVKAGTLFQKFVGDVIEYGSALVQNQTKYINYQTAGVNQMEAQVKLEQAYERLDQADMALQGMQSITPLIEEEWQARRELKISQVNALKIGASQANAQLQRMLGEMSTGFRNELDLLTAG